MSDDKEKNTKHKWKLNRKYFLLLHARINKEIYISEEINQEREENAIITTENLNWLGWFHTRMYNVRLSIRIRYRCSLYIALAKTVAKSFSSSTPADSYS